MSQRPSYATDEFRPRRPRRRVTFWTIAAPVATGALFIAIFVGLSNSCLTSGGCSSTSAAEDADKPANDLKPGARAKVKPGDSVGSIADRFGLTMEEIKACNPLIDPQNIQPGQYLVVSAATCEGADRADAGANPDPLAGETSAAAAKPKTNATAAADPSIAKSARGDRPSTKPADATP